MARRLIVFESHDEVLICDEAFEQEAKDRWFKPEGSDYDFERFDRTVHENFVEIECSKRIIVNSYAKIEG